MSKAAGKNDFRRKLKKANKRRQSRRPTSVTTTEPDSSTNAPSVAFNKVIEVIVDFTRAHSGAGDSAVISAMHSFLAQSPPSGNHSAPLFQQLCEFTISQELSERAMRDAVKELLAIADDLKQNETNAFAFVQYLDVICS